LTSKFDNGALKMKAHLVLVGLITGLLITGSNVAFGGDKGEAMTACEHHITGLYGDDLRMKLKNTRQRKGGVEVKMKVTSGGERFTAKCQVGNDGKLTYSSNKRK